MHFFRLSRGSGLGHCRGGFALCTISPIKHCDDRVYFDRFTFFEFNLRQHAGGRRRYFSVDLVGRDLEQRLVALDAFTDLLQPLCNRSFRDGLAHLRHYHFCRHKFSKKSCPVLSVQPIRPSLTAD